MTTPNLPLGTPVANLPQGVIYHGNLGSVLQNPSAGKYRSLAAGRFPSIVGGTSAGSPSDVGGPLGFVVDLFAKFAENVATADPSTVNHPDDLIPFITDFFEDLPLIGLFADLWDAMMGTYTGDDPVLNFIETLFSPIRSLLELVTGVTGTPTSGEVTDGPLALLFGDFSSLHDFVQSLVNAILQALRGVPVVGGTLSNIISDLGGLNATAVGTKNGIINGWATGSSIGADPGVVGVMAEIRAAIASGATVVEYTSNATWTPPAGLIECFVILVGSGQSASASQGGSAGGNGGIGGEGGGFVAWKTNPDDIPPTVAITVGINGGTSKFGNMYESAPGSSGISNGLGFSATTSAPGKGGNGGKGGTSGGTVGGSSALGVGGTAGAIGSIGTNGGAGGDAPGVPTSTTTKSGAGGGGGGGAGNGAGSNGGKGGNGGFPGGGAGGGGGGGAVGSSGGASGNPGNGIVWLVFKATGS